MPEVVVADGTRIAWEERGTGPTLLLIMGLGADRTAWEKHAAHLEKSFRCILLDNRGAGVSGAPEGPYSTTLMAEDAAEVLKAVGGEPAGVIGVSMGGAIAQRLALGHPDLVSRMVLTASWAGMNPVSEDVFSELRSLKALLTPEAFLQRLQLLIWSPEAYAERAAELRQERLSIQGETMSAAAFAAQVDACVEHDARSALPELEVPALVTCGEMDVFTPLAACLELAELLPSASVERFGGGHAHHWEELDRYNRLCEEFLR
jgi:pimeloyl-ACP methyl ester carboxylesterase